MKLIVLPTSNGETVKATLTLNVQTVTFCIDMVSHPRGIFLVVVTPDSTLFKG